MGRKIQYVVAAAVAAAAAAIALGTADRVQDRQSREQDLLGPGTCRVLDRPQTAEDLAAINGYTGVAAVDLTDARLLAVVQQGRRYLLAPTRNQLCLVA